MRHKLMATACIALCLSGTAFAKTSNIIAEQHNVTISSAVGICQQGIYAVVQVQGNNAYYTFNGSTPSSTNGFLLQQNQTLPILGNAFIVNFKIIQAASGATLSYMCSDNGGDER